MGGVVCVAILGADDVSEGAHVLAAERVAAVPGRVVAELSTSAGGCGEYTGLGVGVWSGYWASDQGVGGGEDEGGGEEGVADWSEDQWRDDYGYGGEERALRLL